MKINGEEHSDLCVGIDLGTTNSVLATITVKPNGEIVSTVAGIDRAVDSYGTGKGVSYETKNLPTLPSCVFYNEEDKFKIIVGNFAKSRYATHSYLVAKSIKSQMGKAVAEGLDPRVPDKTPAQISSRILAHMLKHAAQNYRQKKIEDVVITVPASFDSIMCQATLEAAQLAGVKTHNSNGSIRQILLPEPQAVLYDFINKVHNGEIHSQILDLSSEKTVMIFDLGGGTLDVTLHRISRRKDNAEVLDVEDLAINRYTLLGGDDFDSSLVEKMFERYLEQYRDNEEVLRTIRREKQAFINIFLDRAEALKIKLSTDKSGNFGTSASIWDDEEDEEKIYFVSGNVPTTGYPYDDAFTVEEIEGVWRKFMGVEYKFDDFKNLDEIAKKRDTRNIIFPILDVLKKCADKLGTEDFKIDAVIMNGGMSRLYLVKDRLEEFFGLEPIVAMDPDLSVARGAAVYHYFLHKYNENISSFQNKTLTNSAKADSKPYIRIANAILPDSLYLMTQGDHFEEIIKTGTELPHKSKVFTGFKLPENARKISIPIARRNLAGDFVVIAKGNISFPERYSRTAADTFVAFSVSMNEQKIIHMDAYTCRSVDGSGKMDSCASEIAIATDLDKAETRTPVRSKPTAEAVTAPVKLAPPLAPAPVLNSLLEYCKRIDHAYHNSDPAAISKYSALVREEKNKIFAAGNPEDFADPILRLFNENSNIEILKMHCEIIGRKIGAVWTDWQKRRLADLCMQQIQRDIFFPSAYTGGESVNTKIQAILALSMCGSDDDLSQLSKLGNIKFKNARLYTHAMTKTNVNWIYGEFKQDCRQIERGVRGVQYQSSVHALGIAFRLSDPRPTKCSVRRSDLVVEICEMIKSNMLNPVEMTTSILAIGLLCDQRYSNNLDRSSVDKARKILAGLNSGVGRFGKSKVVALKMIDGATLTADEEEMLLIKVGD